jgi:hypothetical protein
MRFNINLPSIFRSPQVDYPGFPIKNVYDERKLGSPLFTISCILLLFHYVQFPAFSCYLLCLSFVFLGSLS